MDGSGKSTAASILKDGLESRGRRVLVIAHPNRGTLVGRMELAYLRRDGKAAMVVSTALYVADVLRSLRIMRSRKGRGYDDVIFVRYIMAVAYLSDRLSPLAYRLISRILPQPDVAILVDVDPETAMGRIEERGEELEMFERRDRLAAVRGRMLALSGGWIVLDNRDGLGSLEEQMDGLVPGVTDDSP